MINPEEDQKKSAVVGEVSAISDTANALLKKQEEAAELEKKLKEINSEIHRIESVDLPEMMQEFGVKELLLEDGSKVSIRPIIRASLPTSTGIAREKDPMKRQDMHARFRRGVKYLEEHGAGAIVKNILEADLGKDSAEISEKAQQALRDLGIPSRADQTVNTNSLSSW